MPRKLICRILMGWLFLSWLSAVPAWSDSRPAPPPWIQQKSDSDCGRAVLASLVASKDGDVEAAYRRIAAPADPVKGYSIAEMVSLPPALGIKLTLRAPPGVTKAGDCVLTPAKRAYLEKLGRDAQAGKRAVLPVSVTVAGGHYVLLVGAIGDAFQILDPASPGIKSIGIAELGQLMCGSGYMALEVNEKPASRRKKSASTSR